MTISDTSRAIQHDPEQKWPDRVRIQLIWYAKDGSELIRSIPISGDQFFGLGAYGAPIDGSALIGMIENERRAGRPPVKAPRRVSLERANRMMTNAAKNKKR